MTEIKQSPVTGKYYVEFDEVPTLLFVSTEGYGNTDILYIDGELQLKTHDFEIRSNVEKTTEYTLNAFAVKI